MIRRGEEGDSRGDGGMCEGEWEGVCVCVGGGGGVRMKRASLLDKVGRLFANTTHTHTHTHTCTHTRTRTHKHTHVHTHTHKSKAKCFAAA